MELFVHKGLADDVAIIKTDREKISIVLNHLIKNAIKFSNKGTIDFGYVVINKDIEFFVSDTGIGISKDRLHDIFDGFVRVDYTDNNGLQGAGFGLAISKGIVELLGGKIRVESEPGKGSTFFVRLPYHSGAVDQNLVKNEFVDDESTEHIDNLKALIVEDDSLSELLIKLAVLSRCNEVLIAHNGMEAIEICRNNPDIDLILMDIQMQGFDGYKATREIRTFNKEVIIVAETAFALKGDRERAMEAGCNDYISKPFTKGQLLEVIDRVFLYPRMVTD
jgi:CheY-like chemotaxis protein/anti-sigma regulatory factor (Ser/Thr protein kinase)